MRADGALPPPSARSTGCARNSAATPLCAASRSRRRIHDITPRRQRPTAACLTGFPMNPAPEVVAPAAVAVIGLGNMGVPMGANLIRAGYAVTGFDIAPPAREKFAAAGGRVASDAATAVAGASVVITLLPDGRAVRAALDGVRGHLVPGAVLIDMGLLRSDRHVRAGRGTDRGGLRLCRRTGLRRRQARGERYACHHGGRGGGDYRSPGAALRRLGHFDLPHRGAWLRTRHEGAQQLRLGGGTSWRPSRRSASACVSDSIPR